MVNQITSNEKGITMRKSKKRSITSYGVLILLVCFLVITLAGFSGVKKNDKKNNHYVVWKLSDIKSHLPEGFTVSGNPQIIASHLGKAIHFNGVNDAFFFDDNPIEGLRQFTIELIMKPDKSGPFAQRFLHIGEPFGHRVLLEIRNKGDIWYLDAYLNSETSLTLVDSSKVHAVDKWYDVAFVVENGKMDTYVNGIHELSGKVKFKPFNIGKTSIGVRLNRKYWYKGSIYEVRFVPRKLQPIDFLKTSKVLNSKSHS